MNYYTNLDKYTDITKDEFLAITPEQLNKMSFDELLSLALNITKFVSFDQLNNFQTKKDNP